MAKSNAPPVDEAAAVLPDVQKAFWLRGDLHARFVALLAERRKTKPRTTERELFTEAIEKFVDAD